ncbi:hypothetical protein B0T26DRAFT_733908 [Lasiosphaeria miniovina]|uniref:Uncharacterized protein n=1 Tax=Lasiosphaeria miniovina TaxID=1954250 RepID=A0AA39ZQ72_9PEZI|nr:uncharacterized protein B0T26DRAFT_733908 [Lasiosphaeria miniovina]KAK0701563.1 hypothetical protein B0T26DRAFT_733908 [Lasiosphaeria miniovina]
MPDENSEDADATKKPPAQTRPWLPRYAGRQVAHASYGPYPGSGGMLASGSPTYRQVATTAALAGLGCGP